jgi:hypothetical protein
MSENTNNNVVLTEKEIFDQIVLLQKQLTENSPTSLHRLGEAISNARGESEFGRISDEQVASICAVFTQREETLRDVMKLYERMYNNLQQDKREQKMAEPESEIVAQKRKEFLDFVRAITVGAEPGTYLPDFDYIWKTVFLGQ